MMRNARKTATKEQEKTTTGDRRTDTAALYGRQDPQDAIGPLTACTTTCVARRMSRAYWFLDARRMLVSARLSSTRLGVHDSIQCSNYAGGVMRTGFALRSSLVLSCRPDVDTGPSPRHLRTTAACLRVVQMVKSWNSCTNERKAPRKLPRVNGQDAVVHFKFSITSCGFIILDLSGLSDKLLLLCSSLVSENNSARACAFFFQVPLISQ